MHDSSAQTFMGGALRLAVAGFALVTAFGTARAAVITIDQAKAEAGGVTAGDAPGFPVTISQPGSYQLMGNLTVDSPNLHAIQITADNVTLDLNGFVIQGPVTCSGSSAANIACAPASSGSGIHAYSKSFVTVRNGTIRGFGTGALVGRLGRLEYLQIGHMSTWGLANGGPGEISTNMVQMVEGEGIVGSGTVRNNVVHLVRTNGITAGNNALVIGNRVSQVGYGVFSYYSYSPAVLAHNVIEGAIQGAIHGGVKIDGNACNGALCP